MCFYLWLLEEMQNFTISVTDKSFYNFLADVLNILSDEIKYYVERVSPL